MKPSHGVVPGSLQRLAAGILTVVMLILCHELHSLDVTCMSPRDSEGQLTEWGPEAGSLHIGGHTSRKQPGLVLPSCICRSPLAS